MWIEINRQKNQPIALQIYYSIKKQIHEGKIATGIKLPSTRKLAESLGVSRNSIMEAYELLYAEGYVESLQGSGTVVQAGIFHKKSDSFAETNTFESHLVEAENIIDFRSGVPALDRFPIAEWKKLCGKIYSEVGAKELSYDKPEGKIELREALVEYLYKVRGIECSSKQIFITTGATQAISLISRLLFKPTANVIIEDPSSYGLIRAIGSHGYEIRPAKVDENGILPENIKMDENTAFFYLTPSHQYPLGGVLNIQRRLELIDATSEVETYLVEDDYDSEFRYAGYPVSSLYSLEPTKVIYIGSFSKLLFPSLRLGYIILPVNLVEDFRRLKRYTDVHTAVPEQLALASFIKDGRLEKHIAKMKKLYKSRQKALLDGLEKYFKGKYKVLGNTTGLHVVVEFFGLDFKNEFVERAFEKGVRIHPVEFHAINKGSHKSKLIFGYSHLEIKTIDNGLAVLSNLIHYLT